MKRPIDWREDRSAVREKVAESARCVLPIVLIVVLLCLAAAPMKPDLLLSFLIGGVMLVVGMGLFSLGAEQSMTPIGTKIGTALTRTKNLPLILGVSFALGFAITVAEPDLQVLAETVPHISSTVLLLTVGVGVGLCIRANAAPTGDDSLALSLSHHFKIGIQWVYLLGDLIVLALSLTYIPFSKIIYSLLTVVLSGQLIGLIQKAGKPKKPKTT